MSSVLAAFARGVPKATGLVMGGSSRTRVSQTCSLRKLSTRRISGLSQAYTSNNGAAVDSGSSRPQSISVLARPTRGSIQYQHQQWRLMSSESNDNQEGSVEAAVGSEEESSANTGAAGASAADVDEEPATAACESGEGEGLAAAPAPPAVFLVQVDGIPFDLKLGDLEQWLTDVGVSPVKVSMPERPPDSPRANQNKGRAYVELASEEDTQTALEVNGRALGERWVTVNRLEIPLEECRSISVRGLKNITEEDFAQLLEEEVGSAPVSVRVIPETPTRNQSGLAFAEFATPEEAIRALALDGANIMRRWIDVSLQMQKQRQRATESRGPLSNHPPFGTDVPDGLVLVLKGLPFQLSHDEIMAFLMQYDLSEEDVVELKVPRHNNTNFNTGMAFLHVKDEEATRKAIALKGTYIGERWIDVSPWGAFDKTPKISHKAALEEVRSTVPAKLRKKYPDLPCVVVSGLPFSLSKEQLSNYFTEHGVPESAMVEIEMPLFMHTQNNTGACWLVINEEDAYNKIMNLNGAIIDDRWVTIVDAI